MTRSEFMRAMKALGWRRERVGSGHLKWRHPAVAESLVTSFSPRRESVWTTSLRKARRCLGNERREVGR